MRDSTKGILIGTLATLGVAALALTTWLVGSRAGVVLTDGARIRVPASIAPVREVLWEPADLLPDWINQGDENYEPRLSPDGRTLVFVRGKAGGGADLFITTLGMEGWSSPTPLDGINTPLADELGPALSADGRTLYFYSDREGGQGGYDLWFARRTDDPPAPDIHAATWGPAENLGPSVNSPFNDYGPAPSPIGDTLYFASNRPVEPPSTDPQDAWPATVREQFERRTYDLYASPATDRGFGVPERLASLSTPDNEGTPAVSPAGDFLYFSSDRPGGAGGLDIYRARLREGIVGDPEPIGWPVNTPANELDPAISLGGFALHFSSSRDSGDIALSAGESPGGDTAAQGTDGIAEPPPPAAENVRDTRAHTHPRYAIYSTISREVYREREPLLAGFNWAAAWGAVWPWLLLLALLLALLAVLRRFMRDEQLKRRWRTLSLLAKCLILSLVLHALLGGLFTVWYVAGSVGEFLNRRAGGTRVALVSRSVGSDLASQIRGGLTQLTVGPVEVQSTRATPELDQTARIIQASLPTEASATPDHALERSRDQSADASPNDNRPQFPTPAVSTAASSPPSQIATPASAAGVAASEAALVTTASPTQPASPQVATPMPTTPARAELSAQRSVVADTTPLPPSIPESSDARPTGPGPVATGAPIPNETPALAFGTLGSPGSSAATAIPEPQVRVEADRRVESLEARPDALPASSVVDATPGPLAPTRATPTVDQSLTPFTAARDADTPAAAAATSVSSATIPASQADIDFPPALAAPATRAASAQEATGPTGAVAPDAPLPAPSVPPPSPAQPSTVASSLAPSSSGVADAPLASAVARPSDAAQAAGRNSRGSNAPSSPLDIPLANGGLVLDLPSANAERVGTQESSEVTVTASPSDFAPAPRPGIDLPADSPATARVDLRPGSGEVVDSHLAPADSMIRTTDSRPSPASNVPSTVIPLDASPLPLPSLAIPQAVDEPPAPVEPIGTLAGVVRDATTGEPIPGARVRLDLPGVEPIVARAGTRGQYRLRVPAGVPENIAISAVAPGFTPASVNVRVDEIATAEEDGEPLARDFDLSPLAWDVVPIEADPQVHHLGNDEFEGAINSQFQRASEGLAYQAEFTLGPDQVGSSIRAAELLILAKGAQANNPVRINGRELDKFIVNTPRDGSFGELVFTIPPRWLREGVNTIEVQSVRGSNDLDDFEFVNPRLRLRPSTPREPKPGR